MFVYQGSGQRRPPDDARMLLKIYFKLVSGASANFGKALAFAAL
jgi:hypothetical protein